VVALIKAQVAVVVMVLLTAQVILVLPQLQEVVVLETLELLAKLVAKVLTDW
jgi:hypothetical protein